MTPKVTGKGGAAAAEVKKALQFSAINSDFWLDMKTKLVQHVKSD